MHVQINHRHQQPGLVAAVQARPLGLDNPVHGGMRGWARWARRSLDTGQPRQGGVAWAVAVLVPTAMAAAVHWLLWQFSVVLAFVWMVAVLYVTLGFRQFSHHFSEIRNALDEGNDALAREKLAAWLRVDASSLPRSELLRQVIEHSVLSAHRHVFGVLVCFVVFWALGLGPARGGGARGIRGQLTSCCCLRRATLSRQAGWLRP